jgi:phage FluMu protein Com
MSEKARVHKAGVWFDCDQCGKLLRDCGEHHLADPSECPACKGELRVVGIGNTMVQFAIWSRCRSCMKLWMLRRGELVETKPRSGFEQWS